MVGDIFSLPATDTLGAFSFRCTVHIILNHNNYTHTHIYIYIYIYIYLL